MPTPPSDGKGDGTATTPTDLSTVVDVTMLTQKEATDYRHQLRLAIVHPGTDYDMASGQYEIDQAAYKDQLRRVDDYLRTFDQY